MRHARTDYDRMSLSESDLDSNPIRQFHAWYSDAIARNIFEPYAMTLATSTKDGIPSARIVLLRDADEQGFTFFTNYESRKGHEIDENPRAALLFYWHEVQRQIRIEGNVERVSAQESTDYFVSRPEASRIGAWASHQSEVIDDRQVLEDRFRDYQAQYADGQIPRPPHWGGYRVVPTSFEFWQGRQSRLHDRLRYTRSAAGWTIERLSP